MATRQDIDELNRLKTRIEESLNQFWEIVKDAPRIVRERAEAYPLGNIFSSLDHDNNWGNRYNVTLQCIIEELEGELQDEEEEGPIDDDSYYEFDDQGLDDDAA